MLRVCKIFEIREEEEAMARRNIIGHVGGSSGVVCFPEEFISMCTHGRQKALHKSVRNILFLT